MLQLAEWNYRDYSHWNIDHAGNHLEDCAVTYQAKPFDGWHASKAYQLAKDLQATIEVAD